MQSELSTPHPKKKDQSKEFILPLSSPSTHSEMFWVLPDHPLHALL